MSAQEGTPKKVARLETSDGEQNVSDRSSAPCAPASPFKAVDDRSAPSTPSRRLNYSSAPPSPFRSADRNALPTQIIFVDHRSAPPSPFRPADFTTASSTAPRHTDGRSAPPSPFRPADMNAPSSPFPDFPNFEYRSAPSTPARLADYGSAPSTPFKQAHRSTPSTPSRHQPEGNLVPVEFKLLSAPPGKFAQPKVAGNEPSALPVIAEDVDMEDTDKPGTSQSDAPKSSLLVERPRTPLTKWFLELGAGLNSMSNSLLGCVKQPTEVEKYEWVCSFRYKPFAGDEKWLGQVYRDQPAHRTHLLGVAISDISCFEVSTRKLQRLPVEVRQKLGACVTFPRQLFSVCPAVGCSRCSLYNCSACPHQYLCDCSTKEEYKGGEWCPHIHAAYSKNMDVYGAEVCLFIQEDSTNLTEKRHIRAMIQGPNKMCKVEPDLYMENFEYLVRSVRYYVKVNASIIPKSKCQCSDVKICVHCEACWCRYSCTCEDYWFDRQVCEHIHNVAMQERRDKISLDEQFSFQHFKESEMVFRNKPSIMRKARESLMMAEHESSYHIPFKYVEEVEKGQKWRLASARDRRLAVVTANTQWQSSCICKKPTTTKGHMCVICNICAFHYKCDCIWVEEVLVCRHMHAVARFRQLEPTDEDKYLAYKLEYYGNMIAEFEKKLRYTANKPIRRPTGVTSSCSEDPTPTSSSASSYTSC